MKALRLALLPLVVTTAALAQDLPPATTAVTVPWGDWIVSAATVAQPVVTLVLTGIATWVMGAYIPPWLRMFAGQAAQVRVNQILTKAVQSALAQTADAVSGKELTVDLASTVLARAAQYAIDQAPDLIKNATNNSLTNLLKMVMARMEELKVVPAGFDLATAQKAVAQKAVEVKGKFDFTEAITKGMGG